MINYLKWLGLNPAVKHKIAEKFGMRIPHGGMVVVDGKIINDGYSLEDLVHYLSVEKIQEFVGSKEQNEDALLKLLVAKIEQVENVNTEETPKQDEPAKPLRKPGRKASK